MYRVLIEQPNFFQKKCRHSVILLSQRGCSPLVVSPEIPCPKLLFSQPVNSNSQPFDSNPMLVCESGSRRVRIWDERRSNLGAETVERGMAFADKWRDRITITKYVVLERVTRGGRGAEGGTRPSSRILFPVVRSWRRDKC